MQVVNELFVPLDFEILDVDSVFSVDSNVHYLQKLHNLGLLNSFTDRYVL